MASKKQRLDFIRQMIEKNQSFDSIREELQNMGVSTTPARLAREIAEVVESFESHFLSPKMELYRMIKQYDDLYTLALSTMDAAQCKDILDKKMKLMEKLRMLEIS